MKYICMLLLVPLLLFSGCQKADSTQESKALLDVNDPVMIEIWTYYHSRPQEVLDSYIRKFNETVGAEKGIIVNQVAFGTLDALTKALVNSGRNTSGRPDMFITYKGIAATLQNRSELVDFKDYMTEGELISYLDVYAKSGSLLDRPEEYNMISIDRASELMMVNETAFDSYVKLYRYNRCETK